MHLVLEVYRDLFDGLDDKLSEFSNLYGLLTAKQKGVWDVLPSLRFVMAEYSKSLLNGRISLNKYISLRLSQERFDFGIRCQNPHDLLLKTINKYEPEPIPLITIQIVNNLWLLHQCVNQLGGCLVLRYL